MAEDCIVVELEPLIMSPLAGSGRWMSEYGASECAVVARKKRRPREKRVPMSLPTTYPVRRNPVIHIEKPATAWRGICVVQFKNVIYSLSF